MAKGNGLKAVKKLTEERAKRLRMRLTEHGGIPGWTEAVDRVRDSPFLLGDNDRGWIASFDFLTQKSSYWKILEGNYEHNGTNRSPVKGGDRDLWQQARAAAELVERRSSGGLGTAGKGGRDPDLGD